jgi:hypothetical protein
MKVSKALQDKLARSLDQANVREAKTRRRIPIPAPADKRCTKIAVSLFNADLQRIKTIRAYVLDQRDKSISTSQVIRLALRTVRLSTVLTESLDQAAKENGRR